VNKKKMTRLKRKRQRITEQSEELQTMRIYQRGEEDGRRRRLGSFS